METAVLKERTAEEVAILREEYRTRLVEDVCVINFIKVDGNKRRMICTLKPEILEAHSPLEEKKDEEGKTKRKSNDELLVVFDIEKEAWRSFRIDRVVDIATVKKEKK